MFRQLIFIVLIGLGFAAAASEPANDARLSYIVQASSFEAAKAAVAETGGEVTHELRIIRAVGALLSEQQRAELASDPALTIRDNRSAGVSATTTLTATLTDKSTSQLPTEGKGSAGHGPQTF